MSKSRRKNHSEVEQLRGKVRELESTIRRLRRENRSLKKRAHIYENVIDDVADNIEEQDKKCLECGKGEIKIFDFNHIILKICQTCGHQKKVKPRRK